MDGTFYVSPHHFVQLYSIHAMKYGQMFPLVYSFLPNKQEVTYRRMFNQLQDSMQTRGILLPDNLICQMDFETAAMNAARSILLADIRGCYFHFGQAIWRKAVEHGLKIPYSNPDDTRVARLVRRAGVLPLIPLDQMDNCWIRAMEDAPTEVPGVQGFMNYVTETWVEDINPRFSRDIWNHFDNNGPRTTNHLEGWHRGLNLEMARAHPNIFEAIQVN